MKFHPIYVLISAQGTSHYAKVTRILTKYGTIFSPQKLMNPLSLTPHSVIYGDKKGTAIKLRNS